MEHAGRWVHDQPMSTHDTAGPETSGTSAESVIKSIPEQTYQSFTIGTDAEGYDHHYYHPARTVVVYDGRDLDDVIYLGESTVRRYEEWVTNFRSWARKGQFRDMALHYERAER
jgi:hypothetical protein